jgi:HSP20 family protein
MNKNVITLVGFILVAIIGYQAYLLDQASDNPIFKTKKDQPNITVEIEKNSIEKEVRELNQPKSNFTQKEPQTLNQLDPKEMFDEDQIKRDMGKLFQDIFGNPKLQEGIKNSLQQMQEQLQQGLKEMEKEFGKFEELSKNDNFFKDLLGNMQNTHRLKFTDRGDNYYLKLDIPDGKNADIDIKTKANLLTLTITQKVTHDQKSKNSNLHSESFSKNQNILLIPDDAFIDKLQTNYENGVLEITIPKVDKVRS